MASASLAEVVRGLCSSTRLGEECIMVILLQVACLIRVPVELAKQRRQALTTSRGALEILLTEYRKNGLCNGIYKGFSSTILREIPFSFIQFPLWEYFKLHWTEYTGTELNSGSVAICGALAGGIAAAVTTPLDVVKTRVMLSEDSLKHQPSAFSIARTIYRERGLRG